MSEEEYFRKNYPDSCYGDKPLSPYWDFFQDGVEFGERQSEKRIEQLEEENAELQQKWLDESYEKAKLVEKWKHNGENIIQECKDIEGAKTYYEHQFTKAKELLEKFCSYYMYDCDETIKDYKSFEELKKQAE